MKQIEQFIQLLWDLQKENKRIVNIMKLSNVFKKEQKSIVKAKTQTLDKKQLAKVIGGAESLSQEPTQTESSERRAVLSGHSGGWA